MQLFECGDLDPVARDAFCTDGCRELRRWHRRLEFGKPLVVSTLTLAIVTGLSVPDISRNAVANLGWDDILGDRAVVLIEWPDRAEGCLPLDARAVHLAHVPGHPELRRLTT